MVELPPGMWADLCQRGPEDDRAGMSRSTATGFP
jgi:hypothetical protein